MKKIKTYVKLQVLSGSANPAPPIGPALGQHGINIVKFCKEFNDRTKKMEKGIPIPVIISVYLDKSFTFLLKTPPTSYLLKKILKLDKGSSEPNKKIVGKISLMQLKEVLKKKLPDLNSYKEDKSINTIIGTAKSMGILIK